MLGKKRGSLCFMVRDRGRNISLQISGYAGLGGHGAGQEG